MQRVILMAGCAALALAGTAQAQSDPGWYVEGAFGLDFAEEQDLQASASGFGFSASGTSAEDRDVGFAGSARVGYSWANGLRFEGEITYRNVTGDLSPVINGCIDLGGGPTCGSIDLNNDFDNPGLDVNVDIESTTQVLGALGNLYYDFRSVGADWGFTPYVGIGGGLAIVDNDIDISTSFSNPAGPESISATISGDGAELAPAMQLVAGVNVPIDHNWSFGVDYRYFRVFTGDIDHNNVGINFNGTPINANLSVDGDYEAHSVMAALRYSFGAPGADRDDPEMGPSNITGYTDRGWYVEGAGGISFAMEQDLIGEASSDGDSGSARFDHDPDLGFMVAARAGYGWDNGLRFEGEVSYQRGEGDISSIVELCGPGGCESFDLDTELDLDIVLGSISIMSDVDVALSSETQVLAGMANIYYDFLSVQESWGFTPYIGAGGGIALVDNDVDIGVSADVQLGGQLPPGVPSDIQASLAFSGDGAELAPAIQLIAGVNVPLDNHWSVSLDYRYFRAFTGDITHDELSAGGTGFPSINASLAVEGDYQSHNVMAALRYTWGEPIYEAPAPMPEPVAVQTDFIVFFDWDRAVLTSQANNVLDEVVVVYDANGFARINLAGHTDTSGPASYNVGLSERRGESVRQGLVARGVAPDEIVVRAFGETELLVPTPNGVREPQNRRVEIVLM